MDHGKYLLEVSEYSSLPFKFYLYIFLNLINIFTNNINKPCVVVDLYTSQLNNIVALTYNYLYIKFIITITKRVNLVYSVNNSNSN